MKLTKIFLTHPVFISVHKIAAFIGQKRQYSFVGENVDKS
jgi:hypothetical protein